MPKMKTHKGAAKRFRFTGSGKPIHVQGRRGHFRRRKPTRLLQKLDRLKAVDSTSERMIRTALPYGSTR
jgi:large subunit ribosomal protein L35